MNDTKRGLTLECQLYEALDRLEWREHEERGVVQDCRPPTSGSAVGRNADVGDELAVHGTLN